MSNDTDSSDDDEIGGTIPTRLLATEVFALDAENEVGMMVIESDAFDARIAINRTGAERPRDALSRILDGGGPRTPQRAAQLTSLDATYRTLRCRSRLLPMFDPELVSEETINDYSLIACHHRSVQSCMAATFQLA